MPARLVALVMLRRRPQVEVLVLLLVLGLLPSLKQQHVLLLLL